MPEILGEVNNEYVTSDEFVHHFRMRGGFALSGRARSELKKMLIAELVDRKLLLQEARRRRIRLDREEAGEELRRLGARVTEAGDRRMAWEASDYIYEQKVIAELLSAVVRPPDDFTAREVRAWVAEHPGDFRNPERVRLRQIVVNSAADMETVKKRISAGASFEEVARERSTAPEASRGGVLAWVGEADLPTELWDAVRTAIPGEVTGPVATAYGFHLLKVEERRKAGRMDPDSADALARRRISSARRQEAVAAFVGKLRRAARVRLDLKALEPL
jgi:hypothetical protein